MPFEFPNTPIVGDTHTEFGVDYVWDGTVWNLAGGGAMTDYVLKAGDEMTGELIMSGVPVRYMDRSYPTPNASELVLTCDNKGYPNWNKASIRYSSDGYTKGWLEIWDTDVKSVAFKHSGIEVARPIKIGNGVGIHWASDSAQTDPLNLSEGICLYGYGGPSQFGFSITSGTLNYVVQNAGNMHVFRVGAEEVMSVKSDGIRIPGGNLSITGTTTSTGLLIANGGIDADVGNALFNTASFAGAVTFNGTADFNGGIKDKVIQNPVTAGSNGYFIGDSWHGMCFDGATKLQFVEYHGIFEFVKRTTGTTGGLVQAFFNNGNLTCNAATIGGALNINGGAIVPESEHIQIGQSGDRSIGGGDGNGGIVHRVKDADNHKFFVGTDQEFTINSSGGSLLGSLEANGFIDRATGMDLIAEIMKLRADIVALKSPKPKPPTAPIPRANPTRR